MPGIPKPIYIAHFVNPALNGIPFFTELELKWILAEVPALEHRDFLHRARLEDFKWQVAPDEWLRPPKEPELPRSPAAAAAQQEFFQAAKNNFRK